MSEHLDADIEAPEVWVDVPDDAPPYATPGEKPMSVLIDRGDLRRLRAEAKDYAGFSRDALALADEWHRRLAAIPSVADPVGAGLQEGLRACLSDLRALLTEYRNTPAQQRLASPRCHCGKYTAIERHAVGACEGGAR